MKVLALFLLLFVSSFSVKGQSIGTDGKSQFMYYCAPCHAIYKPGNIVGPSLYHITKRHSVSWITQFMIDNEKLVAHNDTVAIGVIKRYKSMVHPKQNNLSASQIKAIIDFLRQGK